MCTVVVRWSPGEAVRLLALRDELTSRVFDDPGAWWPAQPDVIGGRDSTAGGTWCASDVTQGVTALVLNRPEKRIGDAGAPSRGVLPLLGVQHGAAWPEHLEIAGMASFSLVLAGADSLLHWAFDGTELTRTTLGEGTHMVTSGGAEDGKAAAFLPAFEAAAFPDGWRGLVAATEPRDDPAALVVRHQAEDKVFATVFGQLITATPGDLALEFSRTPWTNDPWTHR